MKNIVTILSLVSAFSTVAFAHPEDGADLVELGEGARLVIEKPVEIPVGEVSIGSAKENAPECFFQVRKAESFVRVLRPQTLKILSIEKVVTSNQDSLDNNYFISEPPEPLRILLQTKIYLEDPAHKGMAHPSIDFIICEAPSSEGDDHNRSGVIYFSSFPTIGQFKSALKGVVRLKYAAPSPL